MKEFYNSQTPPSEEPRSTSTHTRETGHSSNHCPEMLEDVNYINNNNNNYYYNRPQQNQSWNQQRPNYLVKRGNPGRLVIAISIGMVDFLEALCDFGSSVNIMLRVLYEKFFTHPSLETTMCL